MFGHKQFSFNHVRKRSYETWTIPCSCGVSMSPYAKQWVLTMWFSKYSVRQIIVTTEPTISQSPLQARSYWNKCRYCGVCKCSCEMHCTIPGSLNYWIVVVRWRSSDLDRSVINRLNTLGSIEILELKPFSPSNYE